MAYPDPSEVRRIASIGGGPIGGGWSAFFLAAGYRVTAYLHDPAEESAFREIIETAWVSLEGLGLAEGASLDNLTVTSDLESAVAHTQFIQESAPEILSVKQALYESLGELVGEDVVIASSTSGLTMTEIQRDCDLCEHRFAPPRDVLGTRAHVSRVRLDVLGCPHRGGGQLDQVF